MSISLTDFVDSVAGERIAELEEQVERLEDIKTRYHTLQEVLDKELPDWQMDTVVSRFKESIKAKAQGENDE